MADEAEVRDNSRAGTPFRLIATYRRGRAIGPQQWPAWAIKPANQAIGNLGR